MALSDTRWPGPDEWLGWPAEQRDAHAERLASNQTLAAQQGARVLALVAEWRAYRLENPPHPHWRRNRAVLAAEVAAHEASKRKARS